MILFTFVMDESQEKALYNKIEIDENLFVRIGSNDMDAFDELYRITERALYAYTLSLVKNHEESLDLMQETYIKILSAAHLYKPMGKPLAWMFTISKNLYLNRIRKFKREIKMESSEMADDLRFSYITDHEDKVVLEAALDILSQEETNIILLYAVTGLKHKEIAESIGLSLSTTLSKYHRALKKLRNHLTERGHSHE